MPAARTQAPDATNASIQAQIAQAKAVGYSDDEITAHLAKMPGYSDKVKAATEVGYKPSEIVSHLAGGAEKPWEKYAAQAQSRGQQEGPWTKYQQQAQEVMHVRMPDGTLIQNVPAGTSKADLMAKLERNGYNVSGQKKTQVSAEKPWENDPIYKPQAKVEAPAGNPWDNDPVVSKESLYQALRNADAAGDTAGARRLAQYIQSLSPEQAPKQAEGTLTKLAKGAAMGLADVGNTVINAGVGAVTLGGKVLPEVAQWNRTRNADMDYITDQNKDSPAFQIGRVGANVGATLPVGGAIGAGIKAVSSAPRAVALANAVGSGGFSTGAAPGAINMLTRAAGGAINGAASTALINPSEAGTGALIGGGLPVGLSGLNKLAPAMGGALRGGTVSDEVRTLAAKAKELGIDIPADRLVNSKPMNALASALNYVPFSGRAASESLMDSQLTRAATRTFGQDSTNMTQALRKAGDDLGTKFDAVLKNNSVNFSQKFMTDIADIYNTAQKELGSDGLKAIGGQIDELIAKGANGTIDGQAAYNIKRTLDRIGQRNAPEAYHALELKKALMDALNDSIGPDAAKAFAKTREQYGNMLALEKLAKNGADGDISIARLANMQNINNKPLQDIADIAAQFVKPREGQHGAMQRAVAGMAAGTVGGPAGFAAAVGGGRAANMLLNSSMAKNFALKDPAVPGALGSRFNALYDMAAPSLYRGAPVAGVAHR